MNCALPEALVLAGRVSKSVERIKHLDVVLCPPAVYIYPIFDYLKARPLNLYLGVQNAMWGEEGEYTGETSLLFVKGICRYVILGHSERRHKFSETDQDINKKVIFALKYGFTPIVCVGEEERFHLEDHFKTEVERMKRQGGIISQIDNALIGASASEVRKAVIAYEPVWAIGTGNEATGAYAASICYIIKSHLSEKYGEDVAKDIKILYGGSTNSGNTKEYMLQPSVDGLLVGGSSLKAAEFVKMCQIISEVKSGRTI